MRAPAQYSTHQGSYSQQYQFYYSRDNQYCAYDPLSGTHFIHSPKNNSWRRLHYSDYVSPTQQYSKSKSRRHNATAEYQQYENEYQHVNPHHDQYMSGERGREKVRRSHREYSPTAKEAAHQSFDESNIDMDCYPEDEGVDVRMGGRSGRSRRPFKDSHRQRSRSGAELRNEKVYAREASRPRESDHRSMHYKNYHTHQCHHGCIHQKQTYGYSFGSNQAGVGYEGSDHDSGLGNDPIPEPPKNMPKVFRWLNETASEYDDSWQFDTQDTTREETHYIHHSHQRSRSPSKRLHRQDSGISMSEPPMVDIEIEIQVEDVPRQRYTSQSPGRSSVPNSSSQTNVQCCGTGLQYDCIYDVPLPPDLPPTPNGDLILISRSQELAAPCSIHTTEPPTFRQADSIYTPSIAAPRPSRPFHEAYSSPSKLPRAPSPPLSPHPTRARRSAERRYPF